jgi:NTP pyrophosphatase (non-canonical NTP hydrolase)
MNINEIIKEAHENAVAHGFWEEDRPFAEQIALMHSELSEALEEYRDGRRLDEMYYSCQNPPDQCLNCLRCQECEHGKPEGIPIELADVIIRICDTCGQYGIDIERAIDLKMRYNKTRPYKHGKKI